MASGFARRDDFPHVVPAHQVGERASGASEARTTQSHQLENLGGKNPLRARYVVEQAHDRVALRELVDHAVRDRRNRARRMPSASVPFERVALGFHDSAQKAQLQQAASSGLARVQTSDRFDEPARAGQAERRCPRR